MPTASCRGINSVRRRNIHQRLRERDGDNCCHCGEPMLFTNDLTLMNDPEKSSIEHVQPFSQGGARTSMSNLKLAHRRCNK